MGKLSMHRFEPRELSSSKRKGLRGLTLIELLVALVIISILAAAALPFAETTVTREKELELRRALRDVRGAIDRFNDDWLAGRIPKTAEGVSEDGYPRSLRVLVVGVDSGDARSGCTRARPQPARAWARARLTTTLC